MSVGMLFVPMVSTVITKMLPAMHQSVQFSIRDQEPTRWHLPYILFYYIANSEILGKICEI